MHWIGVSGSQTQAAVVERDVRKIIGSLLELIEDVGIVSGGALGVDFWAVDEALKINPKGDRVKVILPASLLAYSSHLHLRIEPGDIEASKHLETLILQLIRLQSLRNGSLIENSSCQEIDLSTYQALDWAVVELSNSLIVFQVNNSYGTQDTIDKARIKGIPIKHFSYDLSRGC